MQFDVFVEGRVKIRYRLQADGGGQATPVAEEKFKKNFGPGTVVERVYFEEVPAEQLAKEEKDAAEAAAKAAANAPAK